jgi:hypothetical protein
MSSTKRRIAFLAGLLLALIVGLQSRPRPLGASTTLTGQLTIPSATLVQPGTILTGQALRVGEAINPTTDPRTSTGAVSRPVGSLLYTRDGLVAYLKTGSASTAWVAVSALGGVSLWDRYTRVAQSLVGTTVDSALGTEFDTDNWQIFSSAGSGSQSTVVDRAGAVRLSTGATAGSFARIQPHGLPLYVDAMSTTRFYFYVRAKVVTAVDAATTLDLRLGGVTGNPAVSIGVNGSVSLVAWYYHVNNGGGVTASGALGTIDTNWHDFEIYSDTSIIYFRIDGTVITTAAASNLSAGAAATDIAISNGATAAARTVDIDKTITVVPSN